MCNYTDDDRNTDLRNILFDLSKSQDTLKESSARTDIFLRLEKVYYVDNNVLFRHYYSDIFSVLTQIKSDAEKGDINILGQNLSIIKSYYKSINTDKDKNPIDISDAIRKLYDHINLDIARMSYSDAQDWKLTQQEELSKIKTRVANVSLELDNKKTQIDNLVKQAGNLATKVGDVSTKADKLQEKMENSQKEYIAILGIFSAVVLAFTAGIAFSTSVLENIHHASVYRLIFICCIIGLVLTDIIFLMFRYVEKIVHGSKNKKWCQQYLPITITNAVIITVMAVTVIAWSNGWVEQRNDNYAVQPKSVQTTSDISSDTQPEPEKDIPDSPVDLFNEIAKENNSNTNP